MDNEFNNRHDNVDNNENHFGSHDNPTNSHKNQFDGHEDNFDDDYEYTYTENTHPLEREHMPKHPEFNDKSIITMDKGMRTFLISSVIILILLLGLLVGYFIYALNNGGIGNFNISIPGVTDNNPDSPGNGGTEVNPNSPKINLEGQPSDTNVSDAEGVYTKAAPSVVGIVVYSPNSSIVSDAIAQGSGIVISEDGYIVTNAHVVKNSKQYNIKIVLNTEEEFAGKVIGYDTRTDLAVIKADKKGLSAATFGNSDDVKVGSQAFTLGNPQGLRYASSLTGGIISAVNRSVGNAYLVKYIQTDAAINAGNSGGALLNKYGQVIGVNTVKLSGDGIEGMGFAIPSNTVKSVVDDIIEKGYVSGRSRLGLTGKMVSSYQSQIYNVPIGIIISEISSDSDLTPKGVKPDDIITKVNDVPITGFDMFYKEISNHKPGDTVKLTIYRLSSNRENSSTFDVNVKLLEDKGETQQQQPVADER